MQDPKIKRENNVYFAVFDNGSFVNSSDRDGVREGPFEFESNGIG